MMSLVWPACLGVKNQSLLISLVQSRHALSSLVVFCHVLPCLGLLRPVLSSTSCIVLSCRVQSCLALSWSVTSCLVYYVLHCSVLSYLVLVCYVPPEGRPGMSDVSPLSRISGLSFDSTLLSPLLFFCLVLLPFLSYLFLLAGPFFWTFSRKFFNIFRWEKGFLCDSCLAARRIKLVGGMCSVLPYGTGICCYAFI